MFGLLKEWMNKCCKLISRGRPGGMPLAAILRHGTDQWTRRASGGFEWLWGRAGKSGCGENRASIGMFEGVYWMMHNISLSSMAHKVFSKIHSAWHCFGGWMFFEGWNEIQRLTSITEYPWVSSHIWVSQCRRKFNDVERCPQYIVKENNWVQEGKSNCNPTLVKIEKHLFVLKWWD